MAFLGKRLLSKTGEVLTSTLTFSDPFLIYFSASWCPPCRNFTPRLADFYSNNKKLNKNLEIVLASLDETENAFKTYYEKMPWLSIPFEERSLLENLSAKYGVASIPTLILVNSKGDLINNDCRHKVESNPDHAYSIFQKLIQENSKNNT